MKKLSFFKGLSVGLLFSVFSWAGIAYTIHHIAQDDAASELPIQKEKEEITRYL